MKAAAMVAVMALPFALSAEELTYHDTVPHWAFFGPSYRGTWFHVQDFIPGASGFTVEWVEIWLMNWDLSADDDSPPVLQIWNDDFTVLLGESEVTGSEVFFDPPVETGEDFWCILNTDESSTNPYILTDGLSDGHSFFSDDWMVWEECTTGEFFISAWGTDAVLSNTSWGQLKVTF